MIKMQTTMIHNVKEIVISKVTKQETGSYVKNIKIKTDRDEIEIILFADKKENVETIIDDREEEQQDRS